MVYQNTDIMTFVYMFAHPTSLRRKRRGINPKNSIKSFWEYDERVVAKLHGFKNVHDFYSRSNSRQFLKTIAMPTLVIQAIDDPFMTSEAIPQINELSSFVQLEITEHGGHVGFVAGKNPFKPVYWLEQRIPKFLNQKLNAVRSGKM